VAPIPDPPELVLPVDAPLCEPAAPALEPLPAPEPLPALPLAVEPEPLEGE
jgi:hypothetical protein